VPFALKQNPAFYARLTNMVERLELWSNFFTGSALSESSLCRGPEGCFKKPKKTAI
jgi:hypothetical protein